MSDSSSIASESGQDSEPAAKATTKSGAALLTSNVWLTAAAVAIYMTRAFWVKVQHLKKNDGGGDQRDQPQHIAEGKAELPPPLTLTEPPGRTDEVLQAANSMRLY